MNAVLNDFVESWKNRRCEAFFEGDQKAAEISGRMSKNQRRKFKRYNIVPSAFYAYLQEIGVIEEEQRIPRGGTSLGDLLDFLRWYPYRTEQARSTGQSLFRGLIEADIPFVKNAFASGDFVWEKMENMKAQKS